MAPRCSTALPVEPGAGRLEVLLELATLFVGHVVPLELLVEAGEPLAATFQLQKKLRPPHGDETESVFWDDY